MTTGSASSADEKLSRAALIALVIGSMVGVGLFTLPSKLGGASNSMGALIAWNIAGTGGMLIPAFVFQTLSRRRPDLDAGIYAYAKAGFKNYLSFASVLYFHVRREYKAVLNGHGAARVRSRRPGRACRRLRSDVRLHGHVRRRRNHDAAIPPLGRV